MTKRNEEITAEEFNAAGAALLDVIAQATKGLRYGPDMKSSRALCVETIRDTVTRQMGGHLGMDLETLRAVSKRQEEDARTIGRLCQALGWTLNRLEYGPLPDGSDHDNEQLRACRRTYTAANTLGVIPETTFAPKKEAR